MNYKPAEEDSSEALGRALAGQLVNALPRWQRQDADRAFLANDGHLVLGGLSCGVTWEMLGRARGAESKGAFHQSKGLTTRGK